MRRLGIFFSTVISVAGKLAVVGIALMAVFSSKLTEKDMLVAIVIGLVVIYCAIEDNKRQVEK